MSDRGEGGRVSGRKRSGDCAEPQGGGASHSGNDGGAGVWRGGDESFSGGVFSGGRVESARGDGWQEFGLATQCAGSQAGGRGRHGFEHGWNGGVCAGPKGDAGVIGGGGGEDFASDSGGIESAGDRLSGGFVCGVDADGGGSEGVGI